MSRPPKTTVVLDNIPSGWIVGIDLQFFNTNDLLRGIKLIPDGVHVVHWAANDTSVRSGYFFEAKEGDVHILYWDSQTEKMLIDKDIGELNVTKTMDKLSELYSFMITSPSDPDWGRLTDSIQLRQIEYILPHNTMDSVLTSTDENNILLDAIQRGASERGDGNIANDPVVNSIIDQSDEEIKFTPINLTRVRPNATTEEKTKDSLDKSWYLGELISTAYNGNEGLLVGEFQLAYIGMIVFANYSCGMQWLKLLRIMFYCKECLRRRCALFERVLRLLCLMLEKCPEEYAQEFVDEDFFQVAVGEFDYSVKEQSLHRLVRCVIDLKVILLSRFGIDVQGLQEDEEDGPVVVEL